MILPRASTHLNPALSGSSFGLKLKFRTKVLAEKYSQSICTVSQKKTRHLTLAHNYTKQSNAKQQFLSVMHKLFNLSGEICIFEDKSARRMGYMTQSTILPVTSPNVHQS